MRIWLILTTRPDETLAMSYVYLNRYERFQNSSSSADPLDPYVSLPSNMSPLMNYNH